MSSWFKPTLGYASVQAVETARARLEPLLSETSPVPAEVALIWSDLGRAMLQTEPLGARTGYPVDYLDTVRRWHGAILDAGFHRDVRFESASFDGIKLLVTPLMPHVSSDFLKRAEAFVRAGGVWLCLPVTGTRAAEHNARTDAALGEIEQLAGVETVFAYPITDTDATGDAFGRTTALAGWCCAIRSAEPDTKILGRIATDRLPPGLAFLSEKRVGKGFIVLLTAEPRGDLEAAFRGNLLTHCATLAAISRRETASAGTLICPRTLADGGERWVAVNLDGKGGDVRLQKNAIDAISGERLSAGSVGIGPYEWRTFDF